MRGMSGEDWRVEVELDDEGHGYSLGERLRSLDLGEEARARLGDRVLVTRTGSRLFLYTSTGQEATEAADVVLELARADRLTADVELKRWHPVEEAWMDASLPLPASEADRAREQERREARARDEVEAGGAYDWQVHVRASGSSEAAELHQLLRERDVSAERRWRYLTAGAVSEERAVELVAMIREELPDAVIDIEPTLDVPHPLFVLLRSLLH